MLVGFVKYLPSAYMGCTVPRFTVSCSRCAALRDLLRFGYISSDSVKRKGASCVQGIEYAAQNRQKRKKPCTAFDTQHRAFQCCRFLIAFAPLFFLSCFMQGCHYNIQYLKQFHGIMTKYLVEESGKFRLGEEGVFNGDQCIFMAPLARFVPQLMNELFDWMKEARGNVHPLVLSSVFHYEFVFIHPFSDGNGRMARLWHTVILSKWQPVFEYIPIESQIEKFQDEYYDAISECHVAGESTIFIEFMLSQIDKILDDISTQINEKNEYLPEAVQKLLTAMEYDVPYTGNALMEKLGLKAKEGFRRNYLHPAIEMNLIQMTIPDKPNSRNQRYIKK